MSEKKSYLISCLKNLLHYMWITYGDTRESKEDFIEGIFKFIIEDLYEENCVKINTKYKEESDV